MEDRKKEKGGNWEAGQQMVHAAFEPKDPVDAWLSCESMGGGVHDSRGWRS